MRLLVVNDSSDARVSRSASSRLYLPFFEFQSLQPPGYHTYQIPYENSKDEHPSRRGIPPLSYASHAAQRPYSLEADIPPPCKWNVNGSLTKRNRSGKYKKRDTRLDKGAGESRRDGNAKVRTRAPMSNRFFLGRTALLL